MTLRRQLMALGALLWVSTAGWAGSFKVYVGYADDLRATPFFPIPWNGSSSVDLFSGSGSPFDAGAVRVENTGATPITIENLTVVVAPSIYNATFQIWGGSLPAIINPGQNAIFTQTTQYNFDTSEYVIVGQNLSNNCSVGPLSTTALCVNNAALVELKIDGVSKTFVDTKHVLDTGGFDANCCLFNGNESLQWREIGTTGIDNPGGVPEPGTFALLMPALGGLYYWRRRR